MSQRIIAMTIVAPFSNTLKSVSSQVRADVWFWSRTVDSHIRLCAVDATVTLIKIMQTDQETTFNPTNRTSYFEDTSQTNTYSIIDDADTGKKMPVPPQSQLRLRLFQFAIFSLTYVNYGILHATRSSWSLASKDLITLYGFQTSTITYMNSDFLFFYSLGGFFLAHLGDRYNKNRLIFIMYTLIALVQLALAFLGHGTKIPN